MGFLDERTKIIHDGVRRSIEFYRQLALVAPDEVSANFAAGTLGRLREEVDERSVLCFRMWYDLVEQLETTELGAQCFSWFSIFDHVFRTKPHRRQWLADAVGVECSSRVAKRVGPCVAEIAAMRRRVGDELDPRQMTAWDLVIAHRLRDDPSIIVDMVLDLARNYTMLKCGREVMGSLSTEDIDNLFEWAKVECRYLNMPPDLLEHPRIFLLPSSGWMMS